MCACFLNILRIFAPSPPWNVMCIHVRQGGGLYIAGTDFTSATIPGAATLTNTNVYENQAAGEFTASIHRLTFLCIYVYSPFDVP